MPDVVEESLNISARHVNVGQDQVGKMLPGHFKTRRSAISFNDVIAGPAESQAEHRAQLQFVVNEQNGFHLVYPDGRYGGGAGGEGGFA